MQCTRCQSSEAQFPYTLCSKCLGELWHQSIRSEAADPSKPAMTPERICDLGVETYESHKTQPHPKPGGIYQ